MNCIPKRKTTLGTRIRAEPRRVKGALAPQYEIRVSQNNMDLTTYDTRLRRLKYYTYLLIKILSSCKLSGARIRREDWFCESNISSSSLIIICEAYSLGWVIDFFITRSCLV